MATTYGLKSPWHLKDILSDKTYNDLLRFSKTIERQELKFLDTWPKNFPPPSLEKKMKIPDHETLVALATDQDTIKRMNEVKTKLIPIWNRYALSFIDSVGYKDMFGFDLIDDYATRLNSSTYISGGIFTKLYHGDEIKDVDIFFHNRRDADNLAEFFAKHPEVCKIDDLHQYGNNTKGKIVNLDLTLPNSPGHIQLILKHNFVGQPEIVTALFDYAHTQIYYNPFTNKIHTTPLSFWCIHNKVLVKNKKNLNIVPEYRRKKFLEASFKESE